MPIPKRNQNEDAKKFVSRCMGNETMKKEYPDTKQRVAICLGQTRKTKSGLVDYVMDILGFSLSYNDCEDCGSVEELTSANIIFPESYEDCGEVSEEFEIESTIAAEYQGKKVTLNKPFRTPDGPKKFAVYTTNESGKVVIVRFGDPNMEIKKDIPARRRSFRARMRCETPGPKWKPRYWACKSW